MTYLSRDNGDRSYRACTIFNGQYQANIEKDTRAKEELRIAREINDRLGMRYHRVINGGTRCATLR